MTRAGIIHLLITLVGILLFVPFIGSFYLFDWDEINFAEAAREMIKSGNYATVQIGFENFWEKPPLFIWMQTLCMKIFGVNEFAARLPNAIFGVISLNYIYYLGRKIHGHFKGIFWVIVYVCTMLPFIYYKTGIIDPVFNFFITVSIVHWYFAETAVYRELNPRIHYMLSGLFIGLAILTKGPVALLILGLIVLIRLVQTGGSSWPGWGSLFLFFVVAAGVGTSWYFYLYLNAGPQIIEQFIAYQATLFKGQIAWHNQPFYYHLLVLLFLCFPASVLAIPGLFRRAGALSRDTEVFDQYMKLLFWVVLIIFSIAKTKIVHYSSLCWLPITYFASDALYSSFTDRRKISKGIAATGMILSLIMGIVLSSVFLYLKSPGFRNWFPAIKDNFANAILKDFYCINYLPFIMTAGVFLIIFVVFTRVYLRKKVALIVPFLATLVFACYLYIDIAPLTADIMQGRVIEQYKAKSSDYVEVWGFKSYAAMYYANQSPQLYEGPWKKKNSNDQADSRAHYLFNNETKKPVYLITRMDYKPDQDFLSKMKIFRQAAPYIVWQKK